MVESYNEFGDIIKPVDESVVGVERQLSADQQHRVHQTKDLFEGDCSYCQQAMKKRVKSYWGDDT